MKRLIPTVLIICISASVGCNFTQPDNSENQSEIGSLSEKSNDELIHILEQAEDVNDPAFNLFGKVIEELEKRAQSAAEAAPMLAKAITYKRRDAGIAGKALIPMGQSAAKAIPVLLQNLDNDREDVRLHSVLSLGFIGKPAECSIPKVGNLLWDQDSAVRSAAAAVIEALTNVDLVEDTQGLDPETYSIVALDDPDGSITEKARAWWQDTGKNMKWSKDNCAPIQ